jgi:anti-sigma factor RsiW
MPTLTIDLPGSAYRAALALSPEERRRVSRVMQSDDWEDEEPELTEEDYAAIRRGIEDVKAGRTTPAEIVFARLRAKHGFPKGDNPL